MVGFLKSLAPFILLLAAGVAQGNVSLELPDFTIEDHPFSRHPEFFDGNAAPDAAVIRWYNAVADSDEKTPIFYPRKASYSRIMRDSAGNLSYKPLASLVDALLVRDVKRPKCKNKKNATIDDDRNSNSENEDDEQDNPLESSVTVRVNYDTQVTLLVFGKHVRQVNAENPHEVIGLTGWSQIGGVKNDDPAGTVQEKGCDKPPNLPGCLHTSKKEICRQGEVTFPQHALALQRTYKAGETISLPHPCTLRAEPTAVAGQTLRSVEMEEESCKKCKGKISSFMLLFGKGNQNGDTMAAFPEPTIPRTFSNPITGTAAAVSKPIPNKTCPEWLHDAYAEPTRSMSDGDSADYWRTWHPMIDPVYWCYFTHEHGMYPGPGYRPRFGYTASKTFLEETQTFQDESHNGFKVFSFMAPDKAVSPSARKMVIMTVHAHLSCARRFSARFHTIITAVVAAPGGGTTRWELLFEVQRKADFGGALMLGYDKRAHVEFNENEKRILDENAGDGRLAASRRINVYNIMHVPYCLDPRLFYNVQNAAKKRPFSYETINDGGGTIRGAYEVWKTPLSACTTVGDTPDMQLENGAFTLTFTNAPTAKAVIEGWEGAIRDHWDAVRDEVEWENTEVNPSAPVSSQCKPGHELSRLSGNGLQRRIGMQSSDVTLFGKASCQIQNDTKTVDDVINSDGVFYTDPDFKKVFDKPGSRLLRQFISPKLGQFTLYEQEKSLTEVHSSLQRGMRNLENAIFVDGN